MSKINLNVLEALSKAIYYSIQDAKKVSRLKLDLEKFQSYVHTCVVLGSLPIERNTYDETSIDEYKVIDAISCLSHYVARVNAVTKDSLSEKDHVVQKVLTLQVEELPVVVVTQVEDDKEKPDDMKVSEGKVTPVPEMPYNAKVLPVDVFNRITTILRGALKCGETTITRAKLTLAELADLPHLVDGEYFDTGRFSYAPVKLDTAIYDEYEAESEKVFLKHFKTAIVKELATTMKGESGKVDVTKS